MVEAVGLAASVAGLVGLAGQLLNGCIFVKRFLDDTKDAPTDIRDLHTEMDILAADAGKVSTLFTNSNQPSQVMDGYEAALEQCVNAVTALGQKIEKDVKRFGGGGAGKWWDRMKAATRKKNLAEHVLKVERAKTQLVMVMQELSMNLQHGLQKSTETAIARTHDQGNTMIGWTNRADETMTNILSHVEEIKDSIDELPRLSILESMIQRTVQRALKEHNSELQLMDELQWQDAGGATTSRISEDVTNGESGESSETHREIEPGRTTNCDSQTITRRSKTIYKTSFRSRLFDIDITTSEIEYKRCGDTSDWTPTHTQTKRVTKYNFRTRTFSRKLGLTYRSGNPATFYDPGLYLSFRTYNIVPNDAPIIKACEQLDYLEVRRLFESGLASPLDQDENGYSLVNLIILELWNYEVKDANKLANAIYLLKLLVDCLGGELGQLRSLYTALDQTQRTTKVDTLASYAEALRLLIMHTSEDPFEHDYNHVVRYTDLDFTQTPVYKVIVGQQKWWIDLDPRTLNPEAFEGHFVENDLMMVKDIPGQSLKTALSEGLLYLPYSDFTVDWKNYEKWMHSPLHFVLLFASEARELEQDTIRECCANRLTTLLRSSCDPWSQFRCDMRLFFTIWPRKLLSVTEFAKACNVLDLWESSLKLAGWSPSDIQHLFDEDTYAGIPELFEERLNYTSMDEQQRDFIEALRCGAFAVLEAKETEILCRSKLSYELNFYPLEIETMVKEVASIIQQRSTPGSWLEEEEPRLIPGVDFKLSRGMELWTCIREIWDNELGYIPHRRQRYGMSYYE